MANCEPDMAQLTQRVPTPCLALDVHRAVTPGCPNASDSPIVMSSEMGLACLGTTTRPSPSRRRCTGVPPAEVGELVGITCDLCFRHRSTA